MSGCVMSIVRENSQYTQAHQNRQRKFRSRIHLCPKYDENWDHGTDQIRKRIEACKKSLASLPMSR